jgi:hypothetical protein
MMTLGKLIDEVESLQYSLGLTVLSGFSTVLSALRHDEPTQSLIAVISQSPENKQEVFERMMQVLMRNDQPQYMHPHDPALTGYLYAIHQIDPELGQLAARRFMFTPNLFWARRLAQHILETPVADPK